MKKSRVLLLGLLALMLFPVLAFADVVADQTAAANAQWDFVAKFGPIWGGTLIGYVFAQRLLAKYKSDHPMAQGKWLALVASGVSLLGTFLVMHFDGGSSAGLIVSLIGAGKLLSSPTVPGATAPAPKPSSQAGFARIDLLIITATIAPILIAIGITACQTPAVKNAEHASLSVAEACATQSGLQIVTDDGKPLLSAVSDALLHGAGQTAVEQGISIAEADLKSLPATLENDAINCAIQSAMAAWAPLTGAHGFAGGDARLTFAAQIGHAILVKRGGVPAK